MTHLQNSIILADISRLMGNPDWRTVFSKLTTEAKPADKQILQSLATYCSEAVLDVAFRQVTRL